MGARSWTGFGPLPANLYSVPGTTSLKDPKHPPPSGDSPLTQPRKAQAVGQRVMPFVRINAATVVSRHVIGAPLAKPNMSRRACGRGGGTRTPVAFGSRTSLVRL